MIINHNITALNTHNKLSSASSAQSKSMEKLASGLRINRAGDDAAGLAISEKMRAQVRGLDQASRNAQDGISMIQTAEGALNETHDILQRMRELAVQSATDTNTDDDRVKIQSEVDQLAKEVTRISNTTEFNTQNLLAGGLSSTFHIGSNANQNISLSVKSMDAASLGIAADKNMGGNFVAGGTTLTSNAVSNDSLGKGLTAQTYNMVVTHTAAAVTEVGDTIAGGGAVTTQGFTGSRDEANVQFKTTAVDGTGKITAMEFSKDGGSTWSSASVNSSGANAVVSYQGATLTMTTAAGNLVGQSYTANFNARKDSIQLQDASAANIGSAVTVYSDQDSATIGDASSGRTIKLNSTSLGDLVSGTATQTVVKQQSTAAVTNNGKVTSEAVAQAGIDVSTQASANTAITTINKAIETVSSERSNLGATQNRLDHTINNLKTSSENLTAAESRVRDVDMAKEMMNQTKNSILAQAAQAMLAQANQTPQGVLQLLR